MDENPVRMTREEWQWFVLVSTWRDSWWARGKEVEKAAVIHLQDERRVPSYLSPAWPRPATSGRSPALILSISTRRHKQRHQGRGWCRRTDSEPWAPCRGSRRSRCLSDRLDARASELMYIGRTRMLRREADSLPAIRHPGGVAAHATRRSQGLAGGRGLGPAGALAIAGREFTPFLSAQRVVVRIPWGE